ncbi:MAG: hypothetical protein IPK80_06255 [Nannocystis sp.]|nr:hypothetical protein [Nannocystis sp.]
MPANRMPLLFRTAVKVLGTCLLVPLLSACPKGDIGAPCNHGSVEPPASKLVTFPALSCNDLLCIYADEAKAPAASCAADPDCNAGNTDGKDRFSCVSGKCQLSLTYVLTRSMCSRRCESDADCEDGGITDKILFEDSSCELGFKCAIIQQLGEFCCEKLCVCADDLSEASADALATDCMSGKIMCDTEMPAPL